MTAIASDAQQNVDFYTGVLGLRLVKLTVNFDDPSSYHFYYGDTVGTPGTILTFFSWPGARRARDGHGVVETTHLRVPVGSLDWWEERLQSAETQTVLQEGVLRFSDPDGLQLEMSEGETPNHVQPWTKVVPQQYALSGMRGVTLRVRTIEATRAVLEAELGLTPNGKSEWSASATGDFVRLTPDAGAPQARTGSGGVHHIAFRSQSEEQQASWLNNLRASGFHASPIMDRQYFRSIYFREPSSVLFEIATDEPGFAVDEPLESLGSSLRLPPQFESRRAEVETRLAPLRLPEVNR